MRKVLLMNLLLWLFITIHSQTKIELWGKFLQNGSQTEDWVYDDYACFFLRDSVLYTSLLQKGFLSQIDLGKKHIQNKLVPMPAIKKEGISVYPISFIPYRDGFLTVYFNMVYFIDSNGKKLFFRTADQETIEQILPAKSGNIILHCSTLSGSKMVLIEGSGTILYQLPLDLYYIPGFSWWPEGDTLKTEYFDIKIEEKRLLKLKEKEHAILDKSGEHVIGYYNNFFFLFSKHRSNKLILRNSDTLSQIKEITLPEEVVRLIKRTRSYNEEMEYTPMMRIISLNNSRHFIVFSCDGFLYMYALTINW